MARTRRDYATHRTRWAVSDRLTGVAASLESGGRARHLKRLQTGKANRVATAAEVRSHNGPPVISLPHGCRGSLAVGAGETYFPALKLKLEAQSKRVFREGVLPGRDAAGRTARTIAWDNVLGKLGCLGRPHLYSTSPIVHNDLQRGKGCGVASDFARLPYAE